MRKGKDVLALAKRMYYGGTVLTMEDILYAQALLVEDGVIRSVKAEGGCNGNLQGVAALLQGMTPEEAVQRMEGIRCGMKKTSCPDQIAQALKGVIT